MSDGHYYGDLSFIGMKEYSLVPGGELYHRTGNIQKPTTGSLTIHYGNGEKHHVSLDLVIFCADNGIPVSTMKGKRIDNPRKRQMYLKRYKNLVSNNRQQNIE